LTILTHLSVYNSSNLKVDDKVCRTIITTHILFRIIILHNMIIERIIMSLNNIIMLMKLILI